MGQDFNVVNALRVFTNVIHQRHDHRVGGTAGDAVGRARLFTYVQLAQLGYALSVFVDNGLHQAIAIAEMVLQRVAVFLACGNGNFVEGYRVDAAVGEQALGCLDKSFPGLGRPIGVLVTFTVVHKTIPAVDAVSTAGLKSNNKNIIPLT